MSLQFVLIVLCAVLFGAVIGVLAAGLAQQFNLEEWARLNAPSPPVAPLIARLEADGYLVDLETGAVQPDPDARPAVIALDARTWLAGLESAGGATIAWACRPEDWDFERGCPKGQ